MNTNSRNDFWSEFREFKKQIPNMNINSVLDKVKDFKSRLTNFYTEPVINGKMEEIDKEVAKILNIKKNFITKKHSILGWEMPSSFIPYIEKGENPEMLPKRLFEAYTAMLDSSEFAMLCDSNIQFMKEYDQFLIDWCSKCYGLDRRIVENNMTNTVEYIYNQAKLVGAL